MQPSQAKRILIVDDDPSIRLALRATLEADGYATTLAADGRAGLDALSREHFDLTILDLSMPEMDGLEMLEKLQQACGSAEAIPAVLVLTAHGSLSAAVETARSGAIDFLHKPVRTEALRAAVRQAIAASSDAHLLDARLLDHGDSSGAS